MKFCACILIVIFLLVAHPQAQRFDVGTHYEDSTPILDPKLRILIFNVEKANSQTVEYHNEKFKPKVNKMLFLDPDWRIEHALLVAKWSAWDNVLLVWLRSKMVDASASTVSPGGIVRVRSFEGIETQNKTISIWKMVKNQCDELDEKKELLGEDRDFLKKWSGFRSRFSKLNKAINSLRKY